MIDNSIRYILNSMFYVRSSEYVSLLSGRIVDKDNVNNVNEYVPFLKNTFDILNCLYMSGIFVEYKLIEDCNKVEFNVKFTAESIKKVFGKPFIITKEYNFITPDKVVLDDGICNVVVGLYNRYKDFFKNNKEINGYRITQNDNPNSSCHGCTKKCNYIDCPFFVLKGYTLTKDESI